MTAILWTWPPKEKWPFEQPGFVFVANAINQIGRELLAEWTGDEGFTPPPLDPLPSIEDAFADTPEAQQLRRRYVTSVRFLNGNSVGPADTDVSQEEWRNAAIRRVQERQVRWPSQIRLRAVCSLMHKFAAGGVLTFAVRDDASGRMLKVPQEKWNCDDVAHRFALCRINPDPRYMLLAPPNDWSARERWKHQQTAWLYVTQESLDGAIAAARQARAKTAPALIPTGTPGRPATARDLMLAEMERRAGEGPLADSKTAETQILLAWLKGKYPGVAQPQLKSARQALGARYDELRAAWRAKADN